MNSDGKEHTIRAVFFDIDGTLTSFVTHEVPDSTKEALEALSAKGIATFICSGRPPAQLDVVKRMIDHEWTGYVATNGQCCFDDEGYRACEPLDPEDVQAFINVVNTQFPDMSAGFCEYDYVYFNQISPYLENMWRSLGKTAPPLIVDNPARTLTHVTFQVSAYIPAGEGERTILAVMPHSRGLRWHPDFTDIVAADGGKPAGMKRFMEKYGWTTENVMAFGDGMNDAEMLAFAGIGVAMGNALPEVKATADYVTCDVDHDGIIRALRHFGVL